VLRCDLRSRFSARSNAGRLEANRLRSRRRARQHREPALRVASARPEPRKSLSRRVADVSVPGCRYGTVGPLRGADIAAGAGWGEWNIASVFDVAEVRPLFITAEGHHDSGAPARAVRPITCTWSSGTFGSSKLITCDTPSTSTRGQRLSVATKHTGLAVAKAGEGTYRRRDHRLISIEARLSELGIAGARLGRSDDPGGPHLTIPIARRPLRATRGSPGRVLSLYWGSDGLEA
jgi:hypothetical protein